MATLKFRGMTIKIRGLIDNNGKPYHQIAVPKALRARVGKATIKTPLDPKNGSPAEQCHALNERYGAMFASMKANETLLPTQTKVAALGLLAINGLKQGEGNSKIRVPSHAPGGYEEWTLSDIFADVLSDSFDGEPNEVTRAAMQALQAPLPLLLSEAFDVYLVDHVKRDDATFVAKQRRYWDYLIKCLGDMAFEGLTIEHARRYRDQRLDQGLESTSVKREIATIRAIINAVNRDQESNRLNPFERLTVQSTKDPDDDGRPPYSREELQILISEAKKYDDEKRRIVLVLAMTGARLNEIVGLRRKDVDLEALVLYIRPHSSRGLKNLKTKRAVPLLPVAAEALKAQLKAHDGEYVFPCYCDGEKSNNNTASATLNSWSRKFVKDVEKSMHSFRHSLRDNLRSVQCPEAVSKEIGGWASNTDVSVGYGQGYPMDVKREWLSKAYQWLK